GTNGTIQFSGYGTGIIHSVNGLLTSSGIVAADLTAGDFSSAINSGTYSINISGNASTSSASFYAVNAGLASFANAAATSSTAFYSTNAGHASSADAATSATTASAAFTATHVTSVDLANNVGSSILSILNGGTGTSSTPSNGKLLIGNSSNGYTIAGLTGGQGVAIQEGSGSITVNSTFFNQALGALFEGNTTQDFLLGGTTTNSSTTNYARFGILNVNSASAGNPTASLSAGTAGAAFFDSTGALQTTNKQSLTLGGGKSGNVVLSGTTLLSSLGLG